MTELPPDVVDALRRGEPIEAMKLLRASAKLSLKDARQAIDRAAGRPAPGASQKASLQEFFRAQAAKAGAAAPARPGRASAPVHRPSAPAGPSLHTAARTEPLRAPQAGDLSPGEVPRRGGAWALIAAIAVAVYAYLRLRG